MSSRSSSGMSEMGGCFGASRLRQVARAHVLPRGACATIPWRGPHPQHSARTPSPDAAALHSGAPLRRTRLRRSLPHQLHKARLQPWSPAASCWPRNSAASAHAAPQPARPARRRRSASSSGIGARHDIGTGSVASKHATAPVVAMRQKQTMTSAEAMWHPCRALDRRKPWPARAMA